MDWVSDSDEKNSDNFSWETDEDDKESPADPPGEASEAGPSQPSLYSHFIGMGFSGDMVEKAIKENGEGNVETILETLLTYSAIGNSPSDCEDAPAECPVTSDEYSFDSDIDTDDPNDQDFIEGPQEKDKKLLILVDMGFSPEEADAAIERCGLDSSVLELADSIHAAQMAEEPEGIGWDCPKTRFEAAEGSSYGSTRKKRSLIEVKRKLKRSCLSQRRRDYVRKSTVDFDDAPLAIPKPMIGFGIPFEKCITRRSLPEAAIGPPYFYYENVALAPKGVWDTISRFLYDIEPEFVDSKYFCAAARKRAYIHNLPIENRFPLLPIPAKTIQEALPMTRQWWPQWDKRTQLNCLQTCIASAKLTERIRKALENYGDLPPPRVQEYVLAECRKWNLVWVGHHKVAPLEPDEVEMLLGFPNNHTRGGGISRTERYKSLGNSFQVNTVAYHLSVLKSMFPNGINLLSLFSGIGGAEVALHKLGIHLKTVVSVEKSEVNRNILRSFWEQTNQKGNLIDLDDVQLLNGDRLESLMKRYGGFDLVIGGSPCNNLAGSNRHTRDGLEGEHSSLFFDYFRILDLVKSIMVKNL
ncbi:DNA (cytosine-5)-methyltransferase DRM2 isoform X1 [Dendrobium catenatum]|uniref:DNA (cytosine-5-)-methyltransferase n=3 Tax=Dendrobium catenatum TaxID=906689 RepID=A0A2I0W064_9ASPA|nr:DNA (cytosine-5)-methyltransferase DRM2 isoform X1 [Dendrobium catenatum]XP_020697022.1 DNA (cytosine-5)-methyltransferase DRM2 isoform X1 [Dendrobium catenatum]PKU69055.1 DNA (cytosine-5)-methyltransferase DRM2 [Dendrobium catenatum]